MMMCMKSYYKKILFVVICQAAVLCFAPYSPAAENSESEYFRIQEFQYLCHRIQDYSQDDPPDDKKDWPLRNKTVIKGTIAWSREDKTGYCVDIELTNAVFDVTGHGSPAAIEHLKVYKTPFRVRAVMNTLDKEAPLSLNITDSEPDADRKTQWQQYNLIYTLLEMLFMVSPDKEFTFQRGSLPATLKVVPVKNIRLGQNRIVSEKDVKGFTPRKEYRERHETFTVVPQFADSQLTSSRAISMTTDGGNIYLYDRVLDSQTGLVTNAVDFHIDYRGDEKFTSQNYLEILKRIHQRRDFANYSLTELKVKDK